MSKAKRFLTAPAVTVVLFILAAAMLLFSGIGGARAALTYYSENYTSRVQLDDIGVTLQENGASVSELLTNMLGEDENVKLGKQYTEELSVYNSGSINQFVRVSIYKYWLDADGNKTQALSPDLIDLNLVEGNGWIVDETASTPERTVLYYNSVLASGAGSPLFADSLTIDGAIATKVRQEPGADGAIATVYEYDGVQFRIEASVDAVQEHNAEDAIWSAWGRRVTISGSSLSLN